jgi:hypothetical protein
MMKIIEENIINNEEKIIIVVLDNSSSMKSRACDRNNEEFKNFSRGDFLKHSMRTIIELIANDKNQYYLGIITFDTNPCCVMPISKLDNDGIEKAKKTVSKISPDGMTDIWKGLKKGLDLGKDYEGRKRNQIIEILILTDGEPTTGCIDAISFEKQLKKYIEKSNLDDDDYKFRLSCFVYGYSISPSIMSCICGIGNGMYGYISDYSMIGSVFIHAIANILTDYSGPKDESDDEIIGIMCETIEELINENKEQKRKNILMETKNELINYYQDDFIVSLLEDIENYDKHKGQLMKAIEESHFDRWGKNYLVSYLRALKLKICTNDKDRALQHFTCKEFRNIIEEGKELFINIDPPIPSMFESYANSNFYNTCNDDRYNQMGGNIKHQSDGVNYNDRHERSHLVGNFGPKPSRDAMIGLMEKNRPCFSGCSIVLMDDGSSKRVFELKKGDLLHCGAKVVCVIETYGNGEKCDIFGRNGLLITPWHPIRCDESNGQWVFPKNIFPMLKNKLKKYYNLVLDSVHYVVIGGIDVCTLGHGFSDNDIIKHPFLGTDLVIECLEKKEGWNGGRIQLNGIFKRDSDGLICEMD